MLTQNEGTKLYKIRESQKIKNKRKIKDFVIRSDLNTDLDRKNLRVSGKFYVENECNMNNRSKRKNKLIF